MRVWPMWYNQDRRGAVAAATNKKPHPAVSGWAWRGRWTAAVLAGVVPLAVERGAVLLNDCGLIHHPSHVGVVAVARRRVQIDWRRAPTDQVAPHLVGDGLQRGDGRVVRVVDAGNRDLGEQLAEERGVNKAVGAGGGDVLEVGGGVVHASIVPMWPYTTSPFVRFSFLGLFA